MFVDWFGESELDSSYSFYFNSYIKGLILILSSVSTIYNPYIYLYPVIMGNGLIVAGIIEIIDHS